MTTAIVVHLCDCGHAGRVHGEDDGCRAVGCDCAGYDPLELPEEQSPAPVAQPVILEPADAPPDAPFEQATPRLKRCTRCGEQKPIEEFYARNNDGPSRKRLTRCRDCDNVRPRTRTAARIIRVRARHRAVAALIERHRGEFRELLDYFVRVTQQEAEQLAVEPAAQEHYQGKSTVRLRSGPARRGQDVKDRIDVARCSECIGYHDRGHRCGNCGAEPHAEAS